MVAANEYVFVTEWRVAATIEEVSAILDDPPALPRWWPSVYLDVRLLREGESSGVGRVVELFTTGWLPYTLRWQFVVTESRRPHGFSLEASGDFVGRGVWTLTQDGPIANVVYDWRVRADKPLLRWLSFIMKPIFAANHRWAMARGEESLRLELQRRRAHTAAELAAVPAPPAPTFSLSSARR
jgi:hypothetical protein